MVYFWKGIYDLSTGYIIYIDWSSSLLPGSTNAIDFCVDRVLICFIGKISILIWLSILLLIIDNHPIFSGPTLCHHVLGLGYAECWGWELNGWTLQPWSTCVGDITNVRLCDSIYFIAITTSNYCLCTAAGSLPMYYCKEPPIFYPNVCDFWPELFQFSKLLPPSFQN